MRLPLHSNVLLHSIRAILDVKVHAANSHSNRTAKYCKTDVDARTEVAAAAPEPHPRQDGPDVITIVDPGWLEPIFHAVVEHAQSNHLVAHPLRSRDAEMLHVGE